MKANLPALLELIRERRATQVDYRSGTSKWEQNSKAADRRLENHEMLERAVELVRKHIACPNTTGNDDVTTRGKLKETLMAITELASKHEYIRKLSGGGQGTKQLVKYLLRDKIKDVMIQQLDDYLPNVEGSTIECKIVADSNGEQFVEILDNDQESWWIDGIKKYLPEEHFIPGTGFGFDRPSARDAFPVGMLQSDSDPNQSSPIFLPLDTLGAQSKFESIIGDKICILPCELLDNGLRFQLRNQGSKAALSLEQRVARIKQNVRLHKAFLGILKDTSVWTSDEYVQINPDGRGYGTQACPDNSIIDKFLQEELFDTNILRYLDVSLHSKNGIKNASIDKENGEKFDLKLVHHVERVGRRKTVPLSSYEKNLRKAQQRTPQTSVRNDTDYTRGRGDAVLNKDNRVPRPYRRDQGHPTGLGGTEGKSYTHNVMLGRWNNDGLGQLLGGLTSFAARFLHTKMCGPGSEGYDKLFQNLLGRIEIQLTQVDGGNGYKVSATFEKEPGNGNDPEIEERNTDLRNKLHEICGYFRDGPQAQEETNARASLQAAAVTLAKWEKHTNITDLVEWLRGAEEGIQQTAELDEMGDAMKIAIGLIAVSDDDRFHNRTFLRHKDFPKHDLHDLELGENGACVINDSGKYEIGFEIIFRSDDMPMDEGVVKKEIKEALLTEIGWFGAPPSTFAEKRAAKLLVYQRKLQAKHWIPVGSYTYCKKLAEKNKMCYLPYASGQSTFEHICREIGNPDGNSNSACQKVTDTVAISADDVDVLATALG